MKCFAIFTQFLAFQAYIFQENSSRCVAFLVNNDTLSNVSVMFRNTVYELPQKSISILPDCKNVVFNTATVSLSLKSQTFVLFDKKKRS